MKNIFTEHPHSVNETYFQHMKFASFYGINMLIGSLACFVHAIFPFLCKKTASHFLLKMTCHFVDRMPTIEGKIADLSAIIDQKKANLPKT